MKRTVSCFALFFGALEVGAWWDFLRLPNRVTRLCFEMPVGSVGRWGPGDGQTFIAIRSVDRTGRAALLLACLFVHFYRGGLWYLGCLAITWLSLFEVLRRRVWEMGSRTLVEVQRRLLGIFFSFFSLR